MTVFSRQKKLSPEAQRQCRLKLYARLASLPSLDTLTEREKRTLITDAQHAGYALLDAAAFLQWQREHPAAAARLPKTNMSKEDVENAWETLRGKPPTVEKMKKAGRYVNQVRMWERGEPLPTYWEALQQAQPIAQELIGKLLAGGYAKIPPFPGRQTYLCIEDDGMASEHYNGPEATEEVLFDLIETLKRQPFPFRRCPLCQTIFVPIRKQKYCSPVCTTRAFSSAENPQRREYLRQRMAARRRTARKQQAPQWERAAVS